MHEEKNESTKSRLLSLLTDRNNYQESNKELEALKNILKHNTLSTKNLTSEEKIDILNRRHSSFIENNIFELGQIVKWKPGLRNKETMGYDHPAIVFEILEKPVIDSSKDASSPYFREPLDIVLGFLDDDNDYITFHCDSRRFEPFNCEK